MEKLKMHTPDLAEENYKKLAALFPNAVTETIDDDGNVIRAIDKDVLMQEINTKVVDDGQERYQFTWPDKRKAIILANQPIAKTLRFEKKKSVGKDGTPGGTDSENIYIEGDNLDVLKLLQETYLGKVKMIYIDPPYNTGNDFIYNDDFSQESQGYVKNGSGQYDENGNRLVQNNESNGRFHTDWLNMIYPRLKLAKDLLTNDGAIFISIDDHEQQNLKKMCDEIFGERNFVAQINWKGRSGRQDSKYYAAVHEYIFCYAKNINYFHAGEEIKSGDIYPKFDQAKQRYYKTQLLRKWGSNSRRADRPNLFYPIKAPDGTDVYPMLDNSTYSAQNSENFGRWRHGASTMKKNIEDGNVEFIKQSNGAWVAYEKIYAPLPGEEKTKKYTTWIDETNDGSNVIKTLFGKAIFDYPKTPALITRFIKMAAVEENDIILDFFSGSATTAHAVLDLNAEDSGNRKFILVQIPEVTEEKSEASKAGYKTISEIGEKRIILAGKKIKEETGADIDYGFRCFKIDSSNMKDVYYKPAEVKQAEIDLFADNIKADRTPEDLLIQVMLDLGVLLSSKVERTEIAGKKVFSVADGYLIACFDDDVTEDVVTAIAKKKPFYAVFRDSSMANDSVAANFEQIFATYSPQTVRKVL
jgi:adenine-specific DNA-methyltransferase